MIERKEKEKKDGKNIIPKKKKKKKGGKRDTYEKGKKRKKQKAKEKHDLSNLRKCPSPPNPKRAALPGTALPYPSWMTTDSM